MAQMILKSSELLRDPQDIFDSDNFAMSMLFFVASQPDPAIFVLSRNMAEDAVWRFNILLHFCIDGWFFSVIPDPQSRKSPMLCKSALKISKSKYTSSSRPSQVNQSRKV